MSDKVKGIVSIDGKQIGVLLEFHTNIDDGCIDMKVSTVPPDTELITPEQALDRGLITEKDFKAMTEAEE